MDKGHLCKIEYGLTTPPLPRLRRLARLLDISLVALLTDSRAA